MRSWQENSREEVRNDAIRERNVMGQGLKLGNNERGREEERERERGLYLYLYHLYIYMEREFASRKNNIRSIHGILPLT